MSRLKGITGLLAALTVVLAAAGALCGAVRNLSQDASLYGARSRETVRETMGLSSQEEVTAAIGLDAQAQEALAQQIAEGMGRADADFALEPLSAREQAHLRDVRDLMLRLKSASKVCFSLAAALAIVIAWTGARLTKRRKTLLLGVAAGLGALLALSLLLVALLRGQGFARLFTGAHELLFSNDLWLMNPETDVLIRMMPQALFERAAADAALGALRLFAAVGALLIAIEGLVGGMIRRHLAEEDKA